MTRSNVTTLCTGRTVVRATREEALARYYAAERRIHTDPLIANERMMEFAKRLDATAYERDLQIIRDCLERTS